MFKTISIIGDGAMGTVLAMLLREKGFLPRIWGHDREQIQRFEKARENTIFLPGYPLDAAVQFDARDDCIFIGTDLIVSAVPCQYMRGIWTRLLAYVPQEIPVVSVTKGIENHTLLCPTQILSEVLGGDRISAVLSGPTIADELARRLPATACVACSDEHMGQAIQRVFHCDWFRIYTNTDVIGVELAGACKNVIAIAAGIIDGIGAGDNAKAALLTRGLNEITRLGLAYGAKPETFSGLAGLGDLVTTCISPKGRNRSFGQRIGQGQSTQQALCATESVVEGAASCQSLVEMAQQEGIEMPITQAVYEVLFDGKPVHHAIHDLMNRQLRSE